MSASTVLALGLLFWVPFGTLWTQAYYYPPQPEDYYLEPDVHYEHHYDDHYPTRAAAPSRRTTTTTTEPPPPPPPPTTTTTTTTTTPSPTTTTTTTKPEEPVLDVRMQNPTKLNDEEESGGAILFPGSGGSKKCKESQTCSNLDDCPSASRTNSICGWNDTLPLVCCAQTTARGLTTNKAEDEFLLTKDIIPENQCFRRKQEVPKSKAKRQVFPNFDVSKAGDDDPAVDPFVIGGRDVTSNTKWPFMVSILKKLGRNRMFLCGGVLLGRKWVLSAAHCFMNRENGSEYQILSGIRNLKSIESLDEDFLTFTAKDIIVHPDFRFPRLYNDIAMLTFEGLDNFTQTTQPVCLPVPVPPLPVGANGTETDTGNATLLGWGSTQFNEMQSDVLQEAIVPLVDQATCEKVYSNFSLSFKANFPQGITQEVLCAGNKKIPKDACQGDSGGPLVTVDNNNVWRLIGLVSVGFECGRVGFPGIYTRVDQHLDWIKVTAANN